MSNAVDSAAGNGYDGGGGSGRGPRLPRWTRPEILVLIQGKRVVESPGRGRRPGAGALVGAGQPLEPKWAAVSAYCRRHGVDRGPVQCRKRWSNLAGDFKKIKEWERGKGESFWAMRNDVRRERRLPGFFDREVYDILDGAAGAVAEEEEVKGDSAAVRETAIEEEEEAVFDSGRPAGDDGLFSDYEEEKEAATEKGEEEEEEDRQLPPAVAVMPISEKRSGSSHQESSDPGMAKDKHPADNPEKGSPSREGHKRRRTSQEADEETNLQSQLIEVFERNSRILTAHLEAQNANYELDRGQRKEHGDGLLGVLDKLADALGRIADKL